MNESPLTETQIFGNSLFELKKKSLVLNALIDYIYLLEESKNPDFNMFLQKQSFIYPFRIL